MFMVLVCRKMPGFMTAKMVNYDLHAVVENHATFSIAITNIALAYRRTNYRGTGEVGSSLPSDS